MPGPIDILNALLTNPNRTATTPAPGASPQASPIIELLKQNGLYQPIDDKAEMRNAIAEGLQKFSAGMMEHPEYDFLPALATGISKGAGGFIDARNATDTKTRNQAEELMKQLFGFSKAEDLSNYRFENLGVRREQGDRRLDQGETRLDQGQQRLDETGRHNLVTEGQGDTRLGQGQARIDETGRHNLVTEGQGQARVEQGDARVTQGDTRLNQGQQTIDERGRHNQVTEAQAAANAADKKKADAERIRLQTERISFQRDKAKADAEAARQTADKRKLDKANTESAIFARIEGLKSQKAKDLGLNDSTMKLLYPEDYAAKEAEYKAYSEELDKQFKGAGQTSSSAPQTEGSQPVPPPKEAGTQPQVTKWTEKNPAYPKSKAEYDALPPGSVFYNPKTKTLKRKPANGGQVPPQ